MGLTKKILFLTLVLPILLALTRFYFSNYITFKYSICENTVIVARQLFEFKLFKKLLKIFFVPKCASHQLKSIDQCLNFASIIFDMYPFIITDIYLNHTRVCNGLTKFSTWELDVSQLLPISTVKPIDWQHKTDDIGVIRILHISDIHLDFYYQKNSIKSCQEIMCCRANSIAIGNSLDIAGEYGEPACDIPEKTLTAIFEYISENIKFDYIYWTGDAVPHDDPYTSPAEKRKVITKVYETILTHFKNITVFPVIGNHEAFPLDFFPHQSMEHLVPVSSLYNLIADLSLKWLDRRALDTLRRGGFYTMSISPTLRVIALNSNFCATFNYMMMIENFDPYGQLQWLIDVLFAAENKNEKVHLLLHHLLGEEDCHESWSKNLNLILNRFSDTVVALINGHYHKQHFKVIHDYETHQTPKTVIYSAPSITAFHSMNPGFSVYQVDNSTIKDHIIIDVESHFLNLEQSNKKVKPIFFNISSIRKYFNIPSLSPMELAKLQAIILKDENMNKKYFDLFNHFSNNAPELDKDYMLCNFLTTVQKDRRRCFKDNKK